MNKESLDAIEVYNLLRNDEKVNSFLEAQHIITELFDANPEKEYLKSSTKRDYYILLPCEHVGFDSDSHGLVVKKRGLDGEGKNKDGTGGVMFCLSLCNKSLSQIIKSIDEHILEDDSEPDDE